MRLKLAAALLAATLCAAAPATAAGTDPLSASKIQLEQANARFSRGRQLFDRKKFDEALVEFRASHDIVASPNARLFMARCLKELGRIVEAYVELGRTAIEGKELASQDARYVKAAESASSERAELESKIGFIAVTVEHATPETKLKVGNEELRRAAWNEQTPVVPGTTELVVETPGRKAVSKTVTVAAGQHTSVSVDAKPDEPAAVREPVVETKPVEVSSGGSLLRPLAYVAGGIGIVGVATFVIAGAAANSTFNTLNTDCHGPCPPSKANDISSGKTQQTIANVGLAVGIVGLAAGTTLFVLSLSSKKKDAAPVTSLVLTPAFIGVRGTL